MVPMGLIILLVAVLMVACSGGDSTEPAPKQPDPTNPTDPTQPTQPTAGEHELGFTCNFAEPTRGVGDGEFTTALLKQSGFGVYCWYTGLTHFDPAFTEPKTHIKDYLGDDGQLLMNNQKVEWKDWNGTGEVWGYTPKKYWPTNASELLTLRAYAPYTSYVMTDVHGMPQLPVVVDKDDYRNGTQHDPLWGTGRLVLASGEYDLSEEQKKYGHLYDNITYEMSGDYRLANASETRNGIIDWYFHHGMSCLMFTCSVIADPGCDKVTITRIEVTKLYTQGLLSLSSPTASESEKPIWDERSGDMKVKLSNVNDSTDLASKPFEITTGNVETTPVNLLSHGLLIIPREHATGDGLQVTITYTIDSNSDPLTAVGTIKRNFEGNTKYTLGLKLTPSTGGLDIDIVQSAFTPWYDGGTGDREVYNW